jgi:hypothetical protein
MAAKVLINKVNIQNRLNRTLTKKTYVDLATRNAQIRFDTAEREALREFDNHEITKELLDGPQAESKFLARGNLASFIGFEDASLEIGKLRNKLEQGFRMNERPQVTINKNGITYSYQVKAPDLQEIYDSTPTPDNWSNKGWTELIEKGISNFIYYLFFEFPISKSRSGYAIQSKHKTKAGGASKVLGIEYIKTVLKTFQSYFKSR